MRSARLAASLAQAGRAQVSHRHPLRFLLVATQIALAVMLLAGAGLLVRSFQTLSRVSPGFEPEQVLTFHLSTTWAETSDPKTSNRRMERVLDALRSTPGIESAATSAWLPGVPNQFQVELKTAEGRAETEPKMLAQARFVTPEYFAALRIPLLAGDMCRDDPNLAAAMINRAFANAYLPGAGAIGRHLLEPSSPYIPPAVIRGIVGDARETGLDRPPVPTVYWCSGSTLPGAFFLLRTHGDPRRMAQTVRLRVHEIEPRRSVYGLTPLAVHLSDAYAQNRLRTVLLSFFALSALALASVGLYGTLSYLVNLRRREIGLRLALGALPGRIARHFLAQGLLVCACGGAGGVALAALSSRLLAGMLYGVSPGDPWTLACVLAAMAAVSVAASCLPALRAARLDPLRVLRHD